MSTTDARGYVRANKTLFVTLLLVLGMGVANAAFPAPSSPPNSNTLEPINVGASSQYRTGPFGVGTNAPIAGSAFEIATTTKGFLPPRLSTTNRDNLITALSAGEKTAARGLTIYNTSILAIQTWDGSGWVTSATSTGSGGFPWGTYATSTLGGTATSSLKNGISLTAGCFAVNNVCVAGGGGGAFGTTTIEQGPAVRATLTSESLFPVSPIPFNSNGASDFVIGTQWNSATGGSFSPKIAGQYLVTVHLEVGECTTAGCYVERNSPNDISAGTNVTLNVKKNGTADKSITMPLEIDKGYDSAFSGSGRAVKNGSFYPKTVEFSHLVNLAANDTITVDASSNRTMYAIGANGQSYISVVRVGSPLFFTPVQYAPVNVPTGGIVYFNSACPSGWSEYTPLQGRYAVGVPSGGSVGTQVGTALTNAENRPAGQHSHGFNDYFYNQTTGGYDTGATSMPYPTGSLTSISNNTDSGTGLVAGTNAPYVQLRACSKD